MLITKKINEVKIYPETNTIGAVEWGITFEENGIISSGLVITLFKDYDTSAMDISTITDIEILDICVEIEGGPLFIDHLTGLHSSTMNDNYQLSLMEPYNVALDKLKEVKLREISLACETAIISGFESSALGTLHTYQSDRDDQLNLIGMVTANTDDYFKCFDGTVWSYKLHTAAQLKQILVDGKDVKLSHLQKFATLSNDIDLATKEELSLIAW